MLVYGGTNIMLTGTRCWKCIWYSLLWRNWFYYPHVTLSCCVL